MQLGFTVPGSNTHGVLADRFPDEFWLDGTAKQIINDGADGSAAPETVAQPQLPPQRLVKKYFRLFLLLFRYSYFTFVVALMKSSQQRTAEIMLRFPSSGFR